MLFSVARYSLALLISINSYIKQLGEGEMHVFAPSMHFQMGYGQPRREELDYFFTSHIDYIPASNKVCALQLSVH